MPLQIDQKYFLNVLLNGCHDLDIKAPVTPDRTIF